MKPTPAAIRKHDPHHLQTYVSGCLSFCWSQTPTKLRLSNKPADAPISNWLQQFQPSN
jgi:hypothetical protein